MPLTDKLVVVGQALEDYLNQGAVTLGLRKVWYGADELIPETPALTITGDSKVRELIETGHMAYNTFRFTITIYHSRLCDTAITRKQCDQTAEQVEDYLHSNIRLNGLVYSSLVESLEPGMATRSKVIMRATRLSWVGKSKTRL